MMRRWTSTPLPLGCGELRSLRVAILAFLALAIVVDLPVVEFKGESYNVFEAADYFGILQLGGDRILSAEEFPRSSMPVGRIKHGCTFIQIGDNVTFFG